VTDNWAGWVDPMYPGYAGYDCYETSLGGVTMGDKTDYYLDQTIDPITGLVSNT